jgi:hypothetical protein
MPSFNTLPVSISPLATPGMRLDRHVSPGQTVIIKVRYVE